LRVGVPPAFRITFEAPESRYDVAFTPTDPWNGEIIVSIAGVEMQWDVVDASTDEAGHLTLGGLTSGSEDIWQDCFWFSLCLDPNARRIEYWGNQIIWRTDFAIN
jgi:hypothetical protein